MENTKIKSVDDLVDFILYGNVDEVSFKVLGEKCPDISDLDDEQHTRTAIAAFIKQLGNNGYKLSKRENLK